MYPEIQFGSISLSTYWLMFFVGVIAMFVLTLDRRQQLGFSAVKATVFTLALTLSGVASVKILYILENIQETLEYGITLGGMSFFGAVFLVPVFMYPVGKLLSLRFGQTGDICALCVLAMIGSIRVGCFLTGCCGGTLVELGALRFHWPTQAVESIGDFAILAVLYDYHKRGIHKGELYPMFMIGYSALRFFVEFFRATPKDWLGLGHGHWFAIFALVIGLIWIGFEKRKASTDE